MAERWQGQTKSTLKRVLLLRLCDSGAYVSDSLIACRGIAVVLAEHCLYHTADSGCVTVISDMISR